jgi:putative transposase
VDGQRRLLSVHDQVSNLFHIPYPETVTADCRRASRQRAFGVWREISKAGAAA